MNSEKSYDSLPNFTAADCKYFNYAEGNDQSLSLHVRTVVCIVMCVFNLKHLKWEQQATLLMGILSGDASQV